MRIVRFVALAVAALMLIAACGDSTPEGDTTTVTGATSTTLESAAETGDFDAAGAVAEVQSEVNELANEIQDSAAAEELNEAWTALSNEITEAVTSVEDGTLQLPDLEAELQQFELTLESLGDEVEPELQQAWDSLRRSVELLMN